MLCVQYNLDNLHFSFMVAAAAFFTETQTASSPQQSRMFLKLFYSLNLKKIHKLKAYI